MLLAAVCRTKEWSWPNYWYYRSSSLLSVMHFIASAKD